MNSRVMRKYSVGIDLGTTNCVVALADLESEQPSIALLPLEQITAPNQVESLPSLASFVYLQTDQEQQSGALAVPGRDASAPVVGEFARRISAEQPERSIAAAKSWLCHSKVDRHAALLPWGAPDELPKLSPVAATQLISATVGRELATKLSGPSTQRTTRDAYRPRIV